MRHRLEEPRQLPTSGNEASFQPETVRCVCSPSLILLVLHPLVHTHFHGDVLSD